MRGWSASFTFTAPVSMTILSAVTPTILPPRVAVTTAPESRASLRSSPVPTRGASV